MIKLSFPFTEEEIRALKVGDESLISGVIHTGRDAGRQPSHEDA
jgi:tartrate dehydratase beta subunit/fumarate hydratase class I family protein